MNQYTTPKYEVLTGNNERDTLMMKILLIVAGLRQTDVARDLGVRKTIVNKVINRKENSARVINYFEQLASGYAQKLEQLQIIKTQVNKEH